MVLSDFADDVIVVDTSVLLTDGVRLLDSLPDCRLVVPSVVLVELERKRSDPRIGVLARHWINLLEGLGSEQPGSLLGDGVDFVNSSGCVVNIRVASAPDGDFLSAYLPGKSNDSTILSVVCSVANTEWREPEGRRVVLLSNDTPMRLYAACLRIEAFEYRASYDGVPSRGIFYVNVSESEFDEADSLSYSRDSDSVRGRDALYSLVSGYVADRFDDIVPLNYAVVLCCGSRRSVFVLSGGEITRVSRGSAGGIRGKNIEQDVAIHMLRESPRDLPIVAVGGVAGSGKTVVTTAVALDELRKGKYDGIVVFRSLHELGRGQSMGYLPGDLDEKIAPWAGAIDDALNVIVASGRARKDRNSKVSPGDAGCKKKVDEFREKIRVEPITYLRGRSLNRTFIILDEAQNFSRYELLNIITRVGEDSKIVLLFDADQVDNKYLRTGRDADVWSVISSFEDSDMFAYVPLKRSERSRLAEFAANLLSSDGE